MTQPAAVDRRYIGIAMPRSPEERERVHTLLRLALAVAQRVQAEEAVPEGEIKRDASEE